MSSLLTLDEYSLHRILFYLGGAEIIRLVLCGAQNLSLKVFGCPSLSFTWYGPGRSRWPSLIASFGRLEHLKYVNAEDVEALPCGGLEIAHLPRTLKSFELRYFDPISPLLSATVSPDSRLSYSASALTTHLPLLETLIIHTNLEIPRNAQECFASIPLTRLEVKCRPTHWIPLQWPDTLKHLSLGALKACEQAESWNFPPHLESLSLSALIQSPHWMTTLPSSLAELTFQDFASRSVYMKNLPLLPRGLKRLTILGYEMTMDLDCLKQLPRTLEKIHMTLDVDYSSSVQAKTVDEADAFWKPHDEHVDEVLDAFPNTLTDLDFVDCRYSVRHLPKLPRGMKSLILRDPERLTENSFFLSSKCLFSSLTSLDLSNGIFRPPQILRLPPSITELKLVELTDDVSLSAPSLQKLYCAFGSLSESGTSRLPRSITQLDIPDRFLQTEECIAQLPPILSTLLLNEVNDHDAYMGGLDDAPPIGNAEILPLLPKTITKMKLDSIPWLSEEWLAGLACLPRLTDLTLQSHQGYSEEMIQFLPRTLRKLTAGIFDLTVEGLKALPRSLLHARLFPQFRGIQTQLRDEDLIHIPRSLYKLYLPKSPLLTSDCIPALPRYLNKLNFEKDAWARFKGSNSFDPLGAYRG